VFAHHYEQNPLSQKSEIFASSPRGRACSGFPKAIILSLWERWQPEWAEVEGTSITVTPLGGFQKMRDGKPVPYLYLAIVGQGLAPAAIMIHVSNGGSKPPALR